MLIGGLDVVLIYSRSAVYKYLLYIDDVTIIGVLDKWSD